MITYKLGEIATFIDYRGKTPLKTESGIPLITAKIVKNGTINTPTEFISPDDYKDWMTRGYPEVGDVVLTTEAPLGEVAQLKNKNVALAQRIITLRGNSTILDNTYLKYFLQSSKGQSLLQARETGTTVVGIKAAELREIEIDLPSIAEQKRIAAILSSLDDKIENNMAINRNLEEQAKAVFKNWFIDFEPFRNDEFIGSELGPIPKGWRVVNFTDVVNVSGGGTPKTANEDFWNGDVPFFTPKDVSSSVYTIKTEKNITSNGLSNCNSPLYPINTVFVTARGTVGKIALAGTPMAMNQSCYALIGKNNISSLWVYHLTHTVIDALKNKASGAVFDAIVTRDFESEKIIMPRDNAIADFEKIITPLYASILNNALTSFALEELRNSLLPQLINNTQLAL